MNNPCNQVCPYNTLRGCTILEHPGEYCPMGNMAKKENKPLTNGDRIRAMTDDELADFLWGFDYEAASKEYEGVCTLRRLISWLKRPAKEET